MHKSCGRPGVCVCVCVCVERGGCYILRLAELEAGGAEQVLTPPLRSGWLQVDGYSTHLEFSISPIAAGGQARLFRTRVSTFTGVGN